VENNLAAVPEPAALPLAAALATAVAVARRRAGNSIGRRNASR
jgi:hypothetical protein